MKFSTAIIRRASDQPLRLGHAPDVQMDAGLAGMLTSSHLHPGQCDEVSIPSSATV